MSSHSRAERASDQEQARRATAADLEALAELWTEITLHHRDLDPLFTLRQGAEGAIRSLLRSMLEDPGCGVFVCEPDDEVPDGIGAHRQSISVALTAATVAEAIKQIQWGIRTGRCSR